MILYNPNPYKVTMVILITQPWYTQPWYAQLWYPTLKYPTLICPTLIPNLKIPNLEIPNLDISNFEIPNLDMPNFDTQPWNTQPPLNYIPPPREMTWAVVSRWNGWWQWLDAPLALEGLEFQSPLHPPHWYPTNAAQLPWSWQEMCLNLKCASRIANVVLVRWMWKKELVREKSILTLIIMKLPMWA